MLFICVGGWFSRNSRATLGAAHRRTVRSRAYFEALKRLLCRGRRHLAPTVASERLACGSPYLTVCFDFPPSRLAHVQSLTSVRPMSCRYGRRCLANFSTVVGPCFRGMAASDL